MTAEDNDWRLRAQESYLQGVALQKIRYAAPRPEWDHDHCEFCGDKFMEAEGYLREGYATLDESYWICPACFGDFRERFEWQTDEASD